ncbi:MAG: phosphopyruvate hydratase [bacterium]|nr:phosphopyruvate hydratase [bacterium]
MTIITAQSNQATISNVCAREILDSRGVPTLECSLTLNNGIVVVTSVSTANSEKNSDLLELRDGDPQRMLGLGVQKAVDLINSRVGPALVGKSPLDQEEMDQALLTLDGTKNLNNLGANTTMVVSQAVLKAAALLYGWPPYYYLFKKYNLTEVLAMPTMIYGVIDGGKHGTDNLNFQEFQIIPANSLSFNRSLEMAVSLFKALGKILKEKGAIRAVGPNGGYTPNLYKNTDAFDLLNEAARTINLVIGRDAFFGTDFDANSFFHNGRYKIKDRADGYTGREWIDYLKDLNRAYGIYAFEDPFAESDLASWQTFTNEFGQNARIIGDSLTRTNVLMTENAIKEKAANTLIVKTGQVPTMTNLIEAIKTARKANWQVIVSNREGETNDDLIADLAVGVGADFGKFGPPNRGERIAKYNRLLQISDELQRITKNA